MTPKEKAIDLVKRFSKDFIIMCKSNDRRLYTNEAIKCALIAVDEIIDNELLSPQLKRHYILKVPPTPQELEYWQEVKQELQNLSI